MLAPERPRRGEGGTRAEIAQPFDPALVVLPARLEPDGNGLIVQTGAEGTAVSVTGVGSDPALPTGFTPGEVPNGAAGLTEAQLAALGAAQARAEAARALEKNATPPLGTGKHRPARIFSAGLTATTGKGSLDAILPQVGSAWSLRWTEALEGPPVEEAEQSVAPELVIVRVADDAYRAVLVVEEGDEAGESNHNGDDPSSGQFDPGDGAAHSEGGVPKRVRWARWFSAQLPPQLRDQVPESKSELRDRLARVLGERKVRYLAAATRYLDAREAAQLLTQVRRWALEQRER